jgi:hypothetical protein
LFITAMVAKDVTYKEHIKMTPYMRLYGKKKDRAKFRAFGCRAYVYLDDELKGKGKYVPRVEAINLCFATDHNISGYKLYIPSTRKVMISNQVQFDELHFPYRKQSVINQNKTESRTNIWGGLIETY